MKKFKALYKGMCDDLKDSEMMIKYAKEIKKDDKDTALADEIAKYAQYRLNHFTEFQELFKDEYKKETNADKESVAHCMWHETEEMLQDWYEEIKHKIDKY